jgi:UDP-N-acetylmuramoylalanine--D-glutamate ligase
MVDELHGKSVIVVGLGQSGVSAARLCLERGAKVIGNDIRPTSDLGEAARALGIELRGGGHEGVPFEAADLVVLSPGVPSFPALERAEARGVPVIGELELASRFVRAPILAVGGTNGKSTVTTAVAALLESASLRVFAGGNLGTPLSEAVDRPFDVLVVEVSSFQLERTPTFRPKVSVLLNVTEDHLDRYPSFEAYANAKGNAFVNQRSDDVAVIPSDDAVCRREADRGRGRLVTFGKGGDYFVENRAIVERKTGARFSLDETDFHGAHNGENAAAAVAATRVFDISDGAVVEGLGRFRALDHRMTLVVELDGVRYYDDSKATNVGAAVTALSGLTESRAVLIAGGRDKLGSYAPLVDALAKKGRAVVVIGEAADRIASDVGNRVPVVRATSIDEAVERARGLAEPGDAVLLSPACSSFDMFTSYKDRGERFAAAARRLAARRSA